MLYTCAYISIYIYTCAYIMVREALPLSASQRAFCSFKEREGAGSSLWGCTYIYIYDVLMMYTYMYILYL